MNEDKQITLFLLNLMAWSLLEYHFIGTYLFFTFIFSAMSYFINGTIFKSFKLLNASYLIYKLPIIFFDPIIKMELYCLLSSKWHVNIIFHPNYSKLNIYNIKYTGELLEKVPFSTSKRSRFTISTSARKINLKNSYFESVYLEKSDSFFHELILDKNNPIIISTASKYKPHVKIDYLYPHTKIRSFNRWNLSTLNINGSDISNLININVLENSLLSSL